MCALIFGMGACSSDKIPNDVMTINELKVVIWDLMVAGEVKVADTTAKVRLNLKDSATSAFNYVLHVHKLSKESFLHSFKYYESHPDKENELVDSLIAYNDRNLKVYEKRQNKIDSLKNKTDSLNKKKKEAKDTIASVISKAAVLTRPDSAKKLEKVSTAPTPVPVK